VGVSGFGCSKANLFGGEQRDNASRALEPTSAEVDGVHTLWSTKCQTGSSLGGAADPSGDVPISVGKRAPETVGGSRRWLVGLDYLGRAASRVFGRGDLWYRAAWRCIFGVSLETSEQ